MSKVHITLVGGQLFPVYLGIREFSADKIVLICSAQTIKEAERIRKELNLSEEKLSIEEFDPVEYSVIVEAVQRCLDKYLENNEVSVNISGGTKPWSLAFFSLFGNKEQVKIIYIDQNCTIYNLTLKEKYTSKLLIDMDLIFRLNGTSVTKSKLITDYMDEDFQSLFLIKKMREINYTDFNKLTKVPDQLKQGSIDKFSLNTGSYISWNKKEKQIELRLCNPRNLEHTTRKFCSPNIFDLMFNTGWFECEVAQILSKWQYAKEVRMNVEFPFADGNTKNEIDVIVNTGTKLLFVECKTQIHSTTDIDKFRNAVRNYGGMGCKSLFVTHSKMKPEAVEKCKESDVLHFSLAERINIAQELYRLLEENLFQINSR